MAHRLTFLADTIASKKKHVDSSFDYLGFADLITPELNVCLFPIRNCV
jgi:hypothetical protein